MAGSDIPAPIADSNAANQSLPDDSSIDGVTKYTTSSGGTGVAATVTFAVDSGGYAVTTTTTTNADGSTTIDNVMLNADGSVASSTQTAIRRPRHRPMKDLVGRCS